MRERPWLYFALGMTTVISIGAVTNQLVPHAPAGIALSDQGITFADGTVQTSAAPRDSRRAFYLTKDPYDGASADGACADGFHFASIWEITEVSTLRYDTIRGHTRADSGLGPPAVATGWARTGAVKEGGDVLSANCAGPLSGPWSSNAAAHRGLQIILEHFESVAQNPDHQHTWNANRYSCGDPARAWCVEDYPGSGSV